MWKIRFSAQQDRKDTTCRLVSRVNQRVATEEIKNALTRVRLTSILTNLQAGVVSWQPSSWRAASTWRAYESQQVAFPWSLPSSPDPFLPHGPETACAMMVSVETSCRLRSERRKTENKVKQKKYDLRIKHEGKPGRQEQLSETLWKKNFLQSYLFQSTVCSQG